MRNNCSNLNSDLYLNHLRPDRICSCGHVNEDAIHYFFESENYTYHRVLMFRETRSLHPLSLNYLLFGKPTLTNKQTSRLFQAVQWYIRRTGRFWPINIYAKETFDAVLANLSLSLSYIHVCGVYLCNLVFCFCLSMSIYL